LPTSLPQRPGISTVTGRNYNQIALLPLNL
jgi:hypothetical protein